MSLASAAPRRLAVLLIALGTLASGCRSYHPDDCDERHECSDDSACHNGQFCQGGRCWDVSDDVESCHERADCRWGEVCINGICCRSCAKDDDCGTGGSCQENYCRPPDDHSPRDGGSPTRPDAGQNTDGGFLPPPPNSGDAGTSEGCRLNADCGPGNYCINSTCYLGCDADNDCPSTESCQQGICRPRPAQQCTLASHCPAGHDCVNGSCRAHCDDDTDCAQGQTCRIGYCQEPPTHQGSGQNCAANCDCPSGERCLEGRCWL